MQKLLLLFLLSLVCPHLLNSQVVVTLNNGTTGATDDDGFTPTKTNFYKQKSQYVIRAGELTALGASASDITSLWLNIYAQPGIDMNNFNIKVGTTSNDNLDLTFEQGLATVYSRATQQNDAMTNGWYEFVFDTPYSWNGTSNLLIEFCWDNGTSYLNYGGVYFHNPFGSGSSIKMSRFFTTDGASNTACNYAGSYSNVGTDYSRPQFKLTFMQVCNSTPTPGNTIASSNLICAQDSVSLSLQNSYQAYTGITFQWQASSDNSNWSDIGGATQSTYKTLIQQNTYFRCQVSCSGYGIGSSTSVFVEQNHNISCYCDIMPRDNNGQDGITKVELNTINQVSTSTPAYSNYTSVSTELKRGHTYPINVNVHTDGDYKYYQSVWIDWNQNGSFENDEMYRVGTAQNVTNGLSNLCPFNITVPSDAALGTTFMRVLSAWENDFYNYWEDPCYYGPSEFELQGEAEDYTITISTDPCNSTPSTATISLTNMAGCDGIDNNFEITATHYSQMYSGIVYQWQISPTGAAPWTNIVGETNPESTWYTANNNQYFRLQGTCTNTGQQSVSNIVEYNTFACEQINIGSGGSHTMATCGLLFYDNGGSSGNYTDDYHTMTINSPSGERLRCEFLNFDTHDNGLYGREQIRYDILKIYDGPSPASPQLFELSGVQTANNVTPLIISSGGSLTFVFESTPVNTRAGWEALITCTNEPNKTATQFCGSAANICDLHNYRGSTSNFYNVERVDNQIIDSGTLYPSSVLDNNSFVSFIAASTTVVININIDQCSGGISGTEYHAVQFAVYAGINCVFTALKSPTTYLVDGLQEGDHTLTIEDLTPGTSYYIMVDGYNGSVCNYSVSAESGIDFPIVDTYDACIDLGSDITINASGGNTYTWTGPNGFSANTAQVLVDEIGVYEVDITSGNAYCPETITHQVAISECVQPLPITLSSCQIQCNGSNPELIWTSSSETNNDYYLIESIDETGASEAIAKIAGAGQSSKTKEYVFRLPEELNGTSYIRLSQFDFDGKSEQLKTLFFDCNYNISDANNSIVVYPNPFNDELIVEFKKIPSQTFDIEIYDPLGRQIQYKTVNLDAQNHTIKLNFSSIPVGMYWLMVKFPNRIERFKLTHQ